MKTKAEQYALKTIEYLFLEEGTDVCKRACNALNILWDSMNERELQEASELLSGLLVEKEKIDE